MNAIADRQAGRIEPPIPIAVVIEQHGAWRVLWAAVIGVFEGRGRSGHARLDLLDDRMRRDIGLEPLGRDRPDPWRHL